MKERGGFVWTSSPLAVMDGHVEIRKNNDTLFGVELFWETGEKVAEREIPDGDITFCVRDTDSIVTHRDGREWIVPGTAYNMNFGPNFTAIGFWEEAKENHDYLFDKRKVKLFGENADPVVIDAFSPFSIIELTDDWVVYYDNNVFADRQTKYYFADGHRNYIPIKEIDIPQHGPR